MGRERLNPLWGCALAVTLLGCGGGAARLAGEEPWGTPPDVRVVALVEGTAVRDARVLGPDARYEFELSAEQRSGADLELWVFGYAADSLATQVRGLPRDAEQLRPLVSVGLDPQVGRSLPPPDGLFVAEVETETLDYTSAEFGAWRRRVDDGLVLNLVVSAEERCADATLGVLATVPLGEVTAVLPRDADSAWVATTTAASPESKAPTRLLAVTSTQGEPRVLASPLRPFDFGARLGDDRQERAVLATMANGTIARFDLGGRRLSTERASVDGRFASVTEVARDDAGQLRALVRTPVGMRPPGVNFDPPLLYRLERGRWVLEVERIFSPMSMLRVAARSRVLFNSLCWLYGNADEAAADWQTMVADGGCPVAGRGTTLRDFDLDERLSVAVGKSGLFAVTQAALPGGLVWTRRDYGVVAFEKVALIGDGEAVVVTLEGEVSLYRQGVLCPIGSVGSRPTAIGARRGVAMIATRADRGARVWRVTVPR
jgi:hypothetical protein